MDEKERVCDGVIDAVRVGIGRSDPMIMMRLYWAATVDSGKEPKGSYDGSPCTSQKVVITHIGTTDRTVRAKQLTPSPLSPPLA
jgi:hypothetical protein